MCPRCVPNHSSRGSRSDGTVSARWTSSETPSDARAAGRDRYPPSLLAFQGGSLRIGTTRRRVRYSRRTTGDPLQRELAKAENALADSRVATAKNAWLEDLYVQHVAAVAFQKRLREAAKAGEALEVARRKAAESGGVYEARCRDAGEETDDLPGIADEPYWNEGFEGLRALLEAGPQRPVAKHRAALARSEAQWRHQRGERIAWALRQGPSTFHHLRPDEREEAERRWAAQRAADTPEERTRRAIERARARPGADRQRRSPGRAEARLRGSGAVSHSGRPRHRSPEHTREPNHQG
jgi:hypothetical protein